MRRALSSWRASKDNDGAPLFALLFAMTISELMTSDVESVASSMPAREAGELMRRKNIHHLVVKNGPNLVGIVSARDLGRRPRDGQAKRRTVADVMTRHVLTINVAATVGRAAHVMRGHSVGCLVVLERGRVAGIVTAADMLNLLGRSRKDRADTRTAIHHRVPHRPRARGGTGMW